MSEPDYIVVGAGINGLVCAAMLGMKGKRVLLLDRNETIGGCIRTEEATLPGFVHDVLATTFVLFTLGPAYKALGPELEKRGLQFANTDRPTGVLLPDGRHAILGRERAANIAMLDALGPGDGASFDAQMNRLGENAPFLFSMLGGSLWSKEMAGILAKEAWKRGPRALAGFFGTALESARAHLESRFSSEVSRALLAPWVLHVGLGPESAYSGQMIKVIAFSLEAAGAPIVKGGARAILEAFARLIGDHGGAIREKSEVERILVENGRAAGVRLVDGTELRAGKGVIASVTPHQLYERFLDRAAAPEAVREGLKDYRYGKGNMQIHYALDRPPVWKDGADLGKVALLHLTPGLDGVSRAVNEAERGLLPAEATICVGQPTALDPSRAPDGKAILWLQLPEAPRIIKGDAAGEIDVPADGTWTEGVREAYADRIEARLAHHVEGFRDSVLARRVYSPADLEAANPNLVGGDPYGGSCALDQFFVWRPLKSSVNHKTYVPGLYHIGASTHPGPGLGGGSGFLVASSL
ncbi:phytoene desaturase family protein [Salinarimonas ramus]|uniref:Pyridine nucleotide-disulfide oxidoreductase domain-containing protein 2 n=1 Tax=Salinarimonas ramus TaxID=690164 RepID=A0A917V6A6_9HYPH|nr:NAD(P)/FAD-dependent oxidoreductase [Salinarimonas ramus]GGK42872.1 FAD-dependent oxidoreductase [Salinarimonas ramus]